jgi:hypothetical protein
MTITEREIEIDPAPFWGVKEMIPTILFQDVLPFPGAIVIEQRDWVWSVRYVTSREHPEVEIIAGASSLFEALTRLRSALAMLKGVMA